LNWLAKAGTLQQASFSAYLVDQQMAKLPEDISVNVQVKGTVIKVPSQKQLEKQFRPYAVELGRLVYAWNRLHEKLAGLFWAITGFKNGAMDLAFDR
jgi:hypothetical protein